MKKINWLLIVTGLVVGAAAVDLTALGNPANKGFCIACFLRDIAGATKLHSAAVVQYFRPEIIGLVLGSTIMAAAGGEFKAKAGSSPATRFILGFFVASIVASFIIQPAFGSDGVSAINKVLDQYKNWAFVLAFTSIGLDTNFKELMKQMQGGKVLWLYIIGQLFNIALTFFAVWLLLSGKIFPIPVLD